MRNYSKVGGKVGRPGYRTSSAFLRKKSRVNQRLKEKLRKVKKRLS